jgi:hypothetical protein
MKKSFGNFSGTNLIACCVFLSLVAARPAAQAEPLQEAKVSHVIKDVRLLATNAAPRPASVNDNVRQGTAVRTGADSRAELTFSDLTITRIGQNTVFSFKGGSREVTLDSGAILLQVPKGAEAAKIRTAAVTASITGGTALMNANSGYPTKLYIMEGAGELCVNSGECVTAHGGQMVMEDNGQLSGPVKFNAKLLFKTSPLLTGFPPLPNEPLFFDVFNELGADSSPPPQKDPIDIISQVQGATPGPTGSGSTGKFGPPSTISSPDPYVISSGTQINTDPMITTNGVTDLGKIYRGPALDGSEFTFLFGSTSAFDTTLGEFFNTNGNGVPVAVFKFSHLQLIGDPTITIPSGATTFLGLVSEGDVTSGGPGATLSFAGLDRLFIATVNGSITLGPEIGFSNIGHVTMYARGAGSNLTLGSAISGADVVHLDAEGTVQINGDVTAATEFRSISGGDFLAGTGIISAPIVDIESLANVNIDGSQFPDFTGDATAIAGATLNFTLNPGGGDTSHFTGTSLTGQGNTINITSTGATPSTFDLETATVSFTAGSGGIQASTILFTNGGSLLLQTTNGGDINIYGTENGMADSPGGDFIDAAGAFTAVASVNLNGVHAGTSIDVGGDLLAGDFRGVVAGTTIHVKGVLSSKEVSAGGDITADHVEILTLTAPNGVLTAGSGGITPFLFLDMYDANRQHTFAVDSIVSPNGIDFSGNQFGGIGGLSSGGRLTINANTITFDSEVGIGSANFNGADSGAFGGGEPAEGGSGGIFIVNTTGNITANNGTDITATTGLNSSLGIDKFVFSGAGGSVTLHSTGGMVTVNDRIEVSSDDAKAPRQSASGGTILLQSDLTTGLGVNVGANARLYSFLDEFAPGPGGSITLSTMGSDITVAPGAVIEADFGTITMDQNDPPGSSPVISVEGATLTCQVLSITGAGDVNIGTTNHVTINAVNISLSAALALNLGDITFSSQNGDSSGNVNLSADQISGTGGLEIFRASLGNSVTGLNVSITTVHDFTLEGGLGLIINVDNSVTALTPGPSTEGANITLDIGGTLTLNNFTGIALSVSNNGGHIGTGGNISVTTGGDLVAAGDIAHPLEANGVSLTVQNANGQIDNGGNVTLMVGNNLSSIQPVSLSVLNNDGVSPPGHIGTGGNVSYSAGGTTSTTDLTLYVDSSNGGTVDTGGNVTLHTIGSVMVDGGFGMEVDSYNGGTINTGGNVTAHFVGDVTDTAGSGHSLNFVIVNGNIPFAPSPGYTGGTIGTGGNIDVTFDGNAETTGTATTGGFAADIFNDGGSIGTGGNISVMIGGNQACGNILSVILTNNNGHITTGGNITFDVTGSITSVGRAVFEILNHGGTIVSDPVVFVHAASFNISQLLLADIDNTGGGSIGGTGGTLSLHSDGAITVGTGMWVLGAVTAGGDVDAQKIASTDITVTSATGAINAGTGGIRRFRFLDGDNSMPNIQHTLTAFSVTSQGGINFDGVAADGDVSPATDAGALTINANSPVFGPSGPSGPTGSTGIQGAVTFNGGNGSPTFGPGNGGTFTVNATNDITVDSDIEATSGAIDPSTSGTPSGNGGTVNLNSTNGTVTVDNRIEVSSAEPTSTMAPFRQSAQGGNIGITSGKTSGTAINISSTAQLLALLDAAAPGPGGNITILASKPGSNGTNSSGIVIDNASGEITASQGTVDIRHLGAGGTISISNANIAADIVKVGALGTNGTLTIGGGMISADTILKLYAPGSNGTIDFNASVTLSSGTAMHLAANTITIEPGFTVTIAGAGGPANIYTEHPDYNFTPGGGYTGPPGTPGNGSFGGNGALDPVPLASAPPFDDAAATMAKSSGALVTRNSGVPSARNGSVPTNLTRSPISLRSTP